MPSVPFGPIEASSVAFLIIFAILAFPSGYIWAKYIRAGYSVRYGFYGASLLCAARIAAFISELVFYSSSYKNISAAIAYVVCLSIGFIGLLECQSALLNSWSDTHISLGAVQKQIAAKVRLINLAALILIIYGSSNIDYSGAPNASSTPLTLLRVGTILFLVLTIIQGLFLLFAWAKFRAMSETLVVLSVSMVFLLWRIIWGVYSSFHREDSPVNFNNRNVKYTVACLLVPEVLSLVLLIGLGFHNIRDQGFASRSPKHMKAAEATQHQEAYDIEAVRNQQSHGVRH